MPTLTFYRQARLDGGIRTGIEIDGETVLGRYQEGADEENPVLAWFVNVEARGESVPATVDEARGWLLQHADDIQAALLAEAEALGAGLDPDAWPQQSSRRIPGEETLLEVTCSAMRRFAGQQIAAILRDVADHWPERVRDLPALMQASA